MFRRFSRDRPVGDVIPYFEPISGIHHLFFLCPSTDVDSTDLRLESATWEHISSADLVHWRRHPTALAPGLAGVDSTGTYTGCIVRSGDLWHLFYVGVDHAAPFPQTICHAVSTDLITFDKDPANPVVIPSSGFETGDWRDPFVYWNDVAGEYWMLISARQAQGPRARRGALAIATSPDLSTWTVRDEPLIAPMSTLVPECAELVSIDGRTILAYSAYTGRPGLHFHERTPDGTWRPLRAFTDGAGWYAARSLRDATGRTLSFGWIPDRAGRTDEGAAIWGGDLGLPRELWLDTDNQVRHRLPAEIVSHLSRPLAIEIRPRLGGWEIAGDAAVSRIEPLSIAVVSAPAAETMRLHTRVTFTGNDGVAGVLIRATEDLDAGVQLLIDPQSRTVGLYKLSVEWTHLTGAFFAPILAHTSQVALPKSIEIEVVLDGECIEVFVDGMSFSHRQYGAAEHAFALFSQHGSVRFDSVSVCMPTIDTQASVPLGD